MTASFYGNQRAKQTLASAVQGGRLCHAYLIEGPDGVGKTAFAERFAAAILCTGGGEKPCGECPACYKTVRRIHPDLHLFLSESKKNSFHVKAVREIKESVYTRPNEGDCKVYILCRADDMTLEAQNALLKMLEEPPEDTVFLLTCRSRLSVPETVRSRCVPVLLGPVSEAECAAALRERQELSEEEAQALASRFHGNIGQALDALTDEAYKADRARAEAVLAAMSEGSEYRLAKALSAYENKKPELYGLLDAMTVTVRDALCRALGEDHPIGTYPEQAEALAGRLTAAQGVALEALFQETRALLDCNASLPLTLMSFGGKIKNILH